MEKVGKVKILRGLSVRERYSRIGFFGMVMIVLIIGAICLINKATSLTAHIGHPVE